MTKKDDKIKMEIIALTIFVRQMKKMRDETNSEAMFNVCNSLTVQDPEIKERLERDATTFFIAAQQYNEQLKKTYKIYNIYKKKYPDEYNMVFADFDNYVEDGNVKNATETIKDIVENNRIINSLSFKNIDKNFVSLISKKNNKKTH